MLATLRNTHLARLLELVQPYHWWMALAAALGFLTIASSVGLMVAGSWIIANAARQPSIADLMIGIVAVRFFGIARGIFRYAERWTTHQITFRILKTLRVWFYQALEPLSPARLMHYHSADLLQRIIRHIETLQEFYARLAAPPLVALMTGTAVSVLLARQHLPSGLVFAVIFFASGLGLVVFNLFHNRRPLADQHLQRSEVKTIVQEALQALPEVTAYNQQQAVLETLHQKEQQAQRTEIELQRSASLDQTLAQLAAGLALLALLLLGIPALDGVLLAPITLGALASFEAIAPLGAAARSMHLARASAAALFQIIDAPPQVSPPENPQALPDRGVSAPRVEILDLSFHYPPDGLQLFDGFSCCIEPGQWLALSGASGAGKTTLVNLLLRFWDHQKGSITLDGVDIRSLRLEDLRRAVSVVEQRPYIFNTSLRENLLIARPEATHEQLKAAARQANIHDFIAQLPQGYGTLPGEHGVRLSGGERQRIAIARALLKDAPFLILDEPTASLDPHTARDIMLNIKENFYNTRRCTALLISHQPQLLALADRVITLEAL